MIFFSFKSPDVVGGKGGPKGEVSSWQGAHLLHLKPGLVGEECQRAAFNTSSFTRPPPKEVLMQPDFMVSLQ